MSNDMVQYETFYEEDNQWRRRGYAATVVLTGVNCISCILIFLYTLLMTSYEILRYYAVCQSFSLSKDAKIGVVLIVTQIFLIIIQLIIFSEYRTKIYHQVVTVSHLNNKIYYDYNVSKRFRRAPFYVHVEIEDILDYHVFRDKILITGNVHIIDSTHKYKHKRKCILHASFQNQTHLLEILDAKARNRNHGGVIYKYQIKKWGSVLCLSFVGILFFVSSMTSIHNIRKNKMEKALESRYQEEFVVKNISTFQTDGLFGQVTNYSADAYRLDMPDVPFKVHLYGSADSEVYDTYGWCLYKKQYISTIDGIMKAADIIESYKIDYNDDYQQNTNQTIESYEEYVKTNTPVTWMDVTFKNLPVDELAKKIVCVQEELKQEDMDISIEFSFNGMEGFISHSDSEQEIKDALQGIK